MLLLLLLLLFSAPVVVPRTVSMASVLSINDKDTLEDHHMSPTMSTYTAAVIFLHDSVKHVHLHEFLACRMNAHNAEWHVVSYYNEDVSRI